jgi:hypothetical protein
MLPEIVADYLGLLDYMQGLSADADEDEIEDCEVRLNEIWVRMDEHEKEMVGKISYGE